MAYPLFDLATKIYWTTTRQVPFSENNVNQFLEILNTSPDFSDFIVKFTGINDQNSVAYAQCFNQALGNTELNALLSGIITVNNVRDAIEYCLSGRAEELTAYCLSKTFQILGNYDQFIVYAESLQGITPATTQDYKDQLTAILGLPQFVFDASSFVIPSED